MLNLLLGTETSQAHNDCWDVSRGNSAYLLDYMAGVIRKLLIRDISRLGHLVRCYIPTTLDKYVKYV